VTGWLSPEDPQVLDLMCRAYRYRRQKFVLALDRPVSDALVRGSTNESHRRNLELVAIYEKGADGNPLWDYAVRTGYDERSARE
jgi:hypothetical protein